MLSKIILILCVSVLVLQVASVPRWCNDQVGGMGVLDVDNVHSLNVFSFGEDITDTMDVEVEGNIPKQTVQSPISNKTKKLSMSSKGDQCNDAYSCVVDCSQFVKGCTKTKTFNGFLSDGIYSDSLGSAYINTCLLKRYKPASHWSWMKNQLITRALAVIQKDGNMVPNQPKIVQADNSTKTLFNLISDIKASKEPIYNVIARLTTIYSSLVRLCVEKPNMKTRLKEIMLKMLDQNSLDFIKTFDNKYLGLWLGQQVHELHVEFNKVPETSRFYKIVFDEMVNFMNNFGHYSLQIAGVPDECNCVDLQKDPNWVTSRNIRTKIALVKDTCKAMCAGKKRSAKKFLNKIQRVFKSGARKPKKFTAVLKQKKIAKKVKKTKKIAKKLTAKKNTKKSQWFKNMGNNGEDKIHLGNGIDDQVDKEALKNPK